MLHLNFENDIFIGLSIELWFSELRIRSGDGSSYCLYTDDYEPFILEVWQRCRIQEQKTVETIFFNTF